MDPRFWRIPRLCHRRAREIRHSVPSIPFPDRSRFPPACLEETKTIKETKTISLGLRRSGRRPCLTARPRLGFPSRPPTTGDRNQLLEVRPFTPDLSLSFLVVAIGERAVNGLQPS